MKQFFKYEYGYINIDADNLYLTNTGNWSETKGMEETSKNSYHSDTLRRARIKAFFAVAVVGLGIAFISAFIRITTNFSFDIKGIIFLVVAPIVAISIYKYLRHDFGPKFRIPLSKLQSAEINEKNITLHFFTKDNSNSSETLKNVEKKGIDYFTSLIKPDEITEQH